LRSTLCTGNGIAVCGFQPLDLCRLLCHLPLEILDRSVVVCKLRKELRSFVTEITDLLLNRPSGALDVVAPPLLRFRCRRPRR
jgi:hypothetical protein